MLYALGHRGEGCQWWSGVVAVLTELQISMSELVLTVRLNGELVEMLRSLSMNSVEFFLDQDSWEQPLLWSVMVGIKTFTFSTFDIKVDIALKPKFGRFLTLQRVSSVVCQNTSSTGERSLSTTRTSVTLILIQLKLLSFQTLTTRQHYIAQKAYVEDFNSPDNLTII